MRHSLLISPFLASMLAAQQPIEIPADPFAAVAKMPVQPANEIGHRLRILNAQGKPEFGVSVLIHEFGTPDPERRYQRAQQTAQQQRRSRAQQALMGPLMTGRRYRTDIEGWVSIARRQKGGAELIILRGRQVFQGRLRGPETTLRLPPTTPLHVRVTGPRGEPLAGVPLGFGDGSEPSLSDAQGRVSLSRSTEIACLPMYRRMVVAEVAAARPFRFNFDPAKYENSFEKPIHFALPALRPVQVELQSRAGVPIKVSGAILLKGGARPVQASLVQGKARFGHVEVGLRVTASAFLGNRPQQSRESLLVGTGPKGGRLVMVLDARPRKFHLRLRGADGKPVQNEQVGVVLWGGEERRADLVQTDAAGNLQYAVPESLFHGPGEVTVRIQRFARHPASPNAIRPIPARFLGSYEGPLAALQQLPIGHELRLRQMVPYLAGRVVDAAGKPVAGVTLMMLDTDVRKRRNPTSYPELFSGPKLITGADGRFAFPEPGAVRPPLRILVRSSHPTLRRAPELPGKQLDLVIRVARLQEVHGSIAADAGAGRTRIRIEASFVGKPGEQGPRRFASARPGSKFVLPACRVGRNTIRFYAGNKLVAEIDNVIVKATEPCRDPRLQDLKLDF